MTRIVPRRLAPGRQTGAPTTGRLAGLLPGRGRTTDRAALLDRLPAVESRPAADEKQLFEQAGLARVLLLMAKVDQESEYLLCRRLAEHALGTVPDPGEVSELGESPESGGEYR
ncbi:hypothetical protein ACH4HG_24835 [Streptomyces coeruleorubidus]|uniref:Uncharacterized protein n=1 Tax=Streptomyces coeruleorubidus TaxID=116188 RepID=A0ABZ0K6P8_STRC4|nr:MULTISPECIES: hypothetical protein [Streptomyces]WOT33467.1 hypothetical protein R5U08_04580 [Streptomyces coeruleorubidus]GGT95224.1 hypothetical protein GCM10010244_20840 [Streptomyces bellus]